MITDETKLLLEILGEIKSTLERIEIALAKGPHITIVSTPVYPPTIAPTYFGDPVTPGWPTPGTFTCSSNNTPK